MADKRDTIQILLDGEVHTVRRPEPTRSVLTWLREDLGRTGTKEGCAEGDCGACTVVLAESIGGSLQVRPINACIRWLPTLDGKALFTTESLDHPVDGPHPVQRAMVDAHASQCGFCSPGFVMSLFALYKTQADPDRAAIDQALAGNLCRCTGYRPIVDAARRMRGDSPEPASDPLRAWAITPCGREAGSAAVQGESILRERLAAIAPSSDVEIEGDGTHYFAPVSLEELTRCYAAHPDATLLAGGTDVGLWATKHLMALPTVIYLGQVAELATIEETAGGLRIGAGVTVTDAVPVLLRHYPELSELFLRFASPPIRCSATLVGNIANGSPIGDSMPALIALGARVELRRGENVRDIALEDLYLGYRKRDLAPGEFVAAVCLPKASKGAWLRSWKISKRRDQDISAVCGAFALDVQDGKICSARVAFGGMAAIPSRARGCENALTGRDWSEATVNSAIAALAHDFAPIGDMRASSDYRTTVAGNLLLRLWHESRAPAYALRANGL